MPVVRVALRPFVSKATAKMIFLGMREIVAACLNCEEGALTPGDIEFIPEYAWDDDYLTEDAVIIVQAFPYRDRIDHVDRNNKMMLEAIQSLGITQFIRPISFAVATELTLAAWDSPQYAKMPSKLDMSVTAAMARADRAIKAFVKENAFQIDPPLG